MSWGKLSLWLTFISATWSYESLITYIPLLPSNSPVVLAQTWQNRALDTVLLQIPDKIDNNLMFAFIMLGTILVPLIFLGVSQILTNTILQSFFWAGLTNIIPIISLFSGGLNASDKTGIILSTVFSAGIFLLGTIMPIQLVSMTAILTLSGLVAGFKLQIKEVHLIFCILYPTLSNILQLLLPFSILGNGILIAIARGLVNASILFLLTGWEPFTEFLLKSLGNLLYIVK